MDLKDKFSFDNQQFSCKVGAVKDFLVAGIRTALAPWSAGTWASYCNLVEFKETLGYKYFDAIGGCCVETIVESLKEHDVDIRTQNIELDQLIIDSRDFKEKVYYDKTELVFAESSFFILTAFAIYKGICERLQVSNQFSWLDFSDKYVGKMANYIHPKDGETLYEDLSLKNNLATSWKYYLDQTKKYLKDIEKEETYILDQEGKPIKRNEVFVEPLVDTSEGKAELITNLLCKKIKEENISILVSPRGYGKTTILDKVYTRLWEIPSDVNIFRLPKVIHKVVRPLSWSALEIILKEKYPSANIESRLKEKKCLIIIDNFQDYFETSSKDILSAIQQITEGKRNIFILTSARNNEVNTNKTDKQKYFTFLNGYSNQNLETFAEKLKKKNLPIKQKGTLDRVLNLATDTTSKSKITWTPYLLGSSVFTYKTEELVYSFQVLSNLIIGVIRSYCKRKNLDSSRIDEIYKLIEDIALGREVQKNIDVIEGLPIIEKKNDVVQIAHQSLREAIVAKSISDFLLSKKKKEDSIDVIAKIANSIAIPALREDIQDRINALPRLDDQKTLTHEEAEVKLAGKRIIELFSKAIDENFLSEDRLSSLYKQGPQLIFNLDDIPRFYLSLYKSIMRKITAEEISKQDQETDIEKINFWLYDYSRNKRLNEVSFNFFLDETTRESMLFTPEVTLHEIDNIELLIKKKIDTQHLKTSRVKNLSIDITPTKKTKIRGQEGRFKKAEEFNEITLELVDSSSLKLIVNNATLKSVKIDYEEVTSVSSDIISIDFNNTKIRRDFSVLDSTVEQENTAKRSLELKISNGFEVERDVTISNLQIQGWSHSKIPITIKGNTSFDNVDFISPSDFIPKGTNFSVVTFKATSFPFSQKDFSTYCQELNFDQMKLVEPKFSDTENNLPGEYIVLKKEKCKIIPLLASQEKEIVFAALMSRIRSQASKNPKVAAQELLNKVLPDSQCYQEIKTLLTFNDKKYQLEKVLKNISIEDIDYTRAIMEINYHKIVVFAESIKIVEELKKQLPKVYFPNTTFVTQVSDINEEEAEIIIYRGTRKEDFIKFQPVKDSWGEKFVTLVEEKLKPFYPEKGPYIVFFSPAKAAAVNDYAEKIVAANSNITLYARLNELVDYIKIRAGIDS